MQFPYVAIALFACLAEDGWPVLVYPGSAVLARPPRNYM